MLGPEELKVMKEDASILNFARGELVDIEALGQRYDDLAMQKKKPGKYICDFALPGDVWKRPNVITIPHLGASTAEAEENAAAMAADTIQDFLQTGALKHSVNFPEVSLPLRDDSVSRICVINENKPGMLAEITGIFAQGQINVLQVINASKGDVAYNVIDIEKPNGNDTSQFTFKSWDDLQKTLTSVPGVKSTRFVYDAPGSGYAIRYNDTVFGVGVTQPGPPHFGAIDN